MSSLGNKRVELFDMGAGASDPIEDDNVQVASCEIYSFFVVTCYSTILYVYVCSLRS